MIPFDILYFLKYYFEFSSANICVCIKFITLTLYILTIIYGYAQ